MTTPASQMKHPSLLGALSESQVAALKECARSTVGLSARTIAANAQTNHGVRVTYATLRSLDRIGCVFAASIIPQRWKITSRGRAAIEEVSS